MDALHTSDCLFTQRHRAVDLVRIGRITGGRQGSLEQRTQLALIDLSAHQPVLVVDSDPLPNMLFLSPERES